MARSAWPRYVGRVPSFAAALAATWLSLQPAAEHGLKLSWHAGDECPGADDVRARIVASLDEADADVIVHASAMRSDDGRWRMLLQVEGPGGRGVRELEGNSCDALVEAAAVVVAIVARGEVADEPALDPVPEPSEPEPPSPPTPVVAPPPVAPPPDAPARRLPGWHVGVAGAFDAAILPRLGATLSAEIGPAWPRVIAALGVTHAIARTRREDDFAGRFSLWAATLRVGPRWQRDTFALAGLVGGELGALLASGREIPINFDRIHLWSALTAAVEVGWRFTPQWAAALSLGMAVPLRRWEFAAGDADLGAIGRIGARVGIRIVYERRGRLRNPRGGGQP